MKTRIRIVEKNNGDMIFYCEEFKPDWQLILTCICLPLVGWMFLPVVLLTNWQAIVIKKENPPELSKTAYFKNLPDAQNFLKEFTAKEEKAKRDQKRITHSYKIKSETKIIYP